MRKFVGYIKNEHFAVGCTGGTVYVYDDNGNEIKKFKGMKYGYTPMFCPKKNIVVVRSTAGIIVVISLDTMQIVKKFRFSEVDYAQDDGWCFSNDGQYLYNCECYKDSFYSRISIYETEEFNCIKRLFTEDSSLKLSEIEFEDRKSVV